MSETEVFISYSHRDNRSPDGEQPGWVQQFHRALATYLTEVLGREPVIFRDTKLPRDQPFPEVLVDELASARAFVCVMSPNYVNSTWCRRELSTFLEKVRNKHGKTSILKVNRIPVELPDHPDDIRDHLGVDFFLVNEETGSFVPMSPSIDRAEYRVNMYEVAQTLCKALQAAPKPHEGSAPALEVTDNGAGKVFLADPTFELRRQGRDLKRDLERHGYQVLPRGNPPYVASELENFVKEQLDGCRLSVHLIGSSYGMVPEGASDSIDKLQNELVGKLAEGTALRRVIWIGGSGAIKDERQSQFVAELREDNRNHEGADLLEGSFEELKTVIFRRLEPEPESETDGDSGSGTQRVYVVCDQADEQDGERTTLPLEDYLFAEELEVIPSEFGADPKEWLADHLESMGSSDGVLIYYGAGNAFWQRKMMRYVDQVKGYGRKRPLRAVAVYIAPPPTREKERFRTREALVLREPESMDPKILDEFVKRIKDGRARRTG